VTLAASSLVLDADLVVCVVSWIAAAAYAAAFPAIFVLARRQRKAFLAESRSKADPGARRRAADANLVATVALGALVVAELVFTPFYARSIAGRTVHAEIVDVTSRAARGGPTYKAHVHYKDASRKTQEFSEYVSRDVYERCSAGCRSDAVIVDGVPFFGQLGSEPMLPVEGMVGFGVVLGLLVLGLRYPFWRTAIGVVTGSLGEAAAALAPKRQDLRLMDGGGPSLFAMMSPRLVWWQRRWLGVFFDVAKLGPRLVLLVDGFFPGTAVEPISKLGPFDMPRMITWGYLGERIALGDPSFDRAFAVESAHPEFARALFDEQGRALVQRMRAAGISGWAAGGRSMTFMLGWVAGEAELAEILATVEAWMDHLHRLAPLTPGPNLCHLCAAGIVGAGTRCTHCGARFHEHCLRTFGACPKPSCTNPEPLIQSIVANATQAMSWKAMAEIRRASSTDFESPAGS
jgi:hypothetical protein